MKNFSLFRLGKTIYNVRVKTIPPIPQDITFDIPPQFRTTSSGHDFLLYDHLYSSNRKRILIFSSDFLMKRMCSSSLVSMDGTFSVVPKMFKQLYIIIAIDEGTHSGEYLLVILQNNLLLHLFSIFSIVAEPVAWILLNDKYARTYSLVFKALKNAALRLKLEFKPNRFITDFESGILKAVREEVGL